MLKCVSMEGGKAQHTRTHNTHTRVRANMQGYADPARILPGEPYWKPLGTATGRMLAPLAYRPHL